MPRKPYDPLSAIPSPEAIRTRLMETLALAERLKLLLEVSEKIHKPIAGNAHDEKPKKVTR